MRGMTRHTGRSGLRTLCVTLLLLAWSFASQGQPRKIYTIKNGNMYIELSKWLSPASVDSFITQYNLEDLKLKECLFQGFSDSLIKMGWKVLNENANSIVITKPLFGADEWNTVAGRIRMAQKQDPPWDWSPLGPSILYGNNRFRNKHSFEIKDDSVVIFYLRGHKDARRVMLAGSFNDWAPDVLSMTKTDSGWIAFVALRPGKYWYKFIRDGDWMIDEDNRRQEDDGNGNTNSVYYKTNSIFRLGGFTNAKKVYLSGSFNNWGEDLEMTKTGTGWELPMFLTPGTHTYRFIVDGKWLSDPANVNKLPNEFGEFNSVIQLGKPSLFTLPGFANAKKVALAGNFNNWRKDELFLTKTATGWEIPYILGRGNFEYIFIVDGVEVTDPANPTRVWRDSESRSYLVIEPNHTFRLKGYPNAKRVYVAGVFNDWDPDNLSMRKEGDEWVFPVHLSPGKHLYKFIVDGEWIIDPGNTLWEQNEHNTGNSVIWIEEQKKDKPKW
jgi:hypothetical protein